jgi:hypothetical protein
MPSNWISYRMRRYAASKIKGNAAKKVTAANFQPKQKDMTTQPMRLNIEMTGKIPLIPKSSWSCLGSMERRDIRVPEAFSIRS